MTTGAEIHYASAAVVRRYSDANELFGAERAILDIVRDDLPQWRMLDLGVGVGRTTLHFAPLVREYVGADLSPAMIEACRARFSGQSWPHVGFRICDARSMPEFEDGSFDFVLFS